MAEETTSGATPSATATAAVQTQQAPAPAEARSLQQPSYDERAKAAKSPAEIRAIIQEAKNAKPAPQKQEATPPPAGDKPAAVEPPPAAPEGETAPVEATAPEGDASQTTETEPEAPEQTPQPEAEEGDDDDDVVKPTTAKKLRLKLPEGDQVGRLAAALLQRNRDWTLGEAYAAAQKQLGVAQAEQPQAAAAKAESDPSKPTLPTTVEAVDQAVETLEEEYGKAMAELRFEDATKITRQIRVHDRHRLNLERQQEVQARTAAVEYDRAYATSETKAVELYPLAADANSAFGKRMIEIEEAMKEMNDPVFSSPDKPLKIAQMVAAEMSIAPRRKGAPVAPAKAAAPAIASAPAKPKQVIPSGSSRSAPSASPVIALQSQVAKITKPHELRTFMKQFKG